MTFRSDIRCNPGALPRTTDRVSDQTAAACNPAWRDQTMNNRKENDPHLLTNVIKMLAAMIDQKGDYIWGHAERVAGNCVRFARHVGWSKQEVDCMYLAGLLHDFGMIYVPRDIICKPGALNDLEMGIVRAHPLQAERILACVPMFTPVLPIIRHHHELYDGSGYPDGLAGEQIPAGSRMLSLIDSYEAMIAPRAHRGAMTPIEAQQFILDDRTRFDPGLASAFVDFLRQRPDISDGIKKERTSIQVSDAVQEIVRQMRQGDIELPVLPRVVAMIGRAMNDPNTTMEEIARYIERDSVLSVKMITVGNSSVYRGTETFTSVRQVVTRLGLKQVQSIVTAVATRNLYKSKDTSFRALMEKLWLHSLVCACAARTIAARLRLDDPERFFLLGVLHDIGMVLLLSALEKLLRPSEFYDLDTIAAAAREYHTGVGAALLQHWKFPNDYARVAEQHERTRFSENTPRDVLVINLADAMAGKMGYAVFNEPECEVWELESARILDIRADTFLTIIDETKAIVQECVRVF